MYFKSTEVFLNGTNGRSRIKHPHFWHWLVNIALAALWFIYVCNGLISLATAPFSLLSMALLLRNTSITLVFLFRRPSTLTSQSPMDWIIGIAGTFLSYLYVPQGAKPVFPSLAPAAYIVTVIALFLSTIAVVSLGRSFGIVPANRGIKTRGFYALVRHPIYSFYIAHDLGWNLLSSSSRNLSVFVLLCLVTYFRARREEIILK